MNPASQLVDSVLAAASSAGPSQFAVGVVSDIYAGGAADGNTLVTVNWRGTDVHASYGAHYTPVIGHVVLMARTQPLAIICRLIGTPPMPQPQATI
jgi:hypothetical protein